MQVRLIPKLLKQMEYQFVYTSDNQIRGNCVYMICL